MITFFSLSPVAFHLHARTMCNDTNAYDSKRYDSERNTTPKVMRLRIEKKRRQLKNVLGPMSSVHLVVTHASKMRRCCCSCWHCGALHDMCAKTEGASCASHTEGERIATSVRQQLIRASLMLASLGLLRQGVRRESENGRITTDKAHQQSKVTVT